ncbi:MAG: aldehyde dehydrogenase family protein [Oscillospiraceae bacterium]|nr:aldehyde dehydrogenase family protein [Oscillospiraceae bacterium]
MNYQSILQSQQAFFASGATLPPDYRETVLALLEGAIQSRREQIEAALAADLGKSRQEAYTTEIAIVLGELRYARRNLKKWTRAKKAPASLSLWPGTQQISPAPYGCVLILAPWNYPFQLCLSPLVSALAAGNCAVVKPSELAGQTALAICALLEEVFSPEYVSVCLGEADTAAALTALPFDKIFFTGSGAVGKKVLAAAAKNLTPVTLELGGKSPCIVDASADLRAAARRIMWGKILNCGQTCVAPDYVLVHRSVKEAFVRQCRAALEEFLGVNPLASPDYGHIINKAHYQRLLGLLDGRKILFGRETDAPSLRLSPTLVDEPDLDDPLMQEEIFGPILPVLPFDSLEQAVGIVLRHPNPLAAYFFARDKKAVAALRHSFGYGGCCINDTILHLASPRLPFGGIGQSGMGESHGQYGFWTFSHRQGCYRRLGGWELPLRYPPYTEKKLRWTEKVMNLFSF